MCLLPRLGIDGTSAALNLNLRPKSSDRTTLGGRTGPAGWDEGADVPAGERSYAQPSSSSRGSLIPKWWATSWMIVLRTWATTSASDEQTLQIASW
jgi:hypothetical protein